MEYFNEEIKQKSYQLLDESLGAFNNQYKIANEIASIIYEMIQHGINKNVFDVNNETIKCVDLTINPHTPNYDFKGKIENLDANGKLYIIIDIPAHCRFLKDKEYIINKLSTVLTHEFMHGNIFLKRFHNDVEINDMPKYYPNLLRIIQNEKEDSPLYTVAYALYSTYYQEVQAFISQTANEIKQKFGGKLKYTNDEIREGIKDSNAYITYSNNIHGFFKEICHMDDAILEEYILQPMSERYNIHFTLNDLKKEMKHAYKVSQKAIEDIYRNAMLLMLDPKLEF